MSLFTLRTQKMLWGRAAGRCSMMDCRIELVEDATETDNEALVGENCHIVADSEDGPRGKDPLPFDQRAKYGNLILLCRNHHRVIDQQVNTYTVEALNKIKSDHESWVKSTLQIFDEAKQRDDEWYATVVDDWVRRCHLDEWQRWTSWLVGGGPPQIWVDIEADLDELRAWLLNRFWPERYADLEAALSNFRRVLSDLHGTFRRHAIREEDVWITEAFYKKIWHRDPKTYDRLLNQYEAHEDLLTDLTFELTRAANLVLQIVRERMSPSFREAEGKCMVQRGPEEDFSYRTYLPTYSAEQRLEGQLYPGAKKFSAVLKSRDFFFGKAD
ncbi:hypothetical protein ACFOMD_15565 [Sphingoaurantiacus capsulatus]|uniref:HNH endonuclease n=1 Tax=Sphingoaurantiacus capsulatus TaxID=1771310 RepID=A0ABV7XD09_9SPHN